MPTKRVIILDPIGAGRFTVALWAVVPPARQKFYASATKSSAFKRASVAELEAIRAGQLVEKVIESPLPDNANQAQIETRLAEAWAEFQQDIDGVNLWNQYGTFLDDTGQWTVGGSV